MRLPSQPSTRATSALALLLAFLMAATTPALAQVETGQITGTVTDPQGAVVPGVSVTVRSQETGATRTTTTTGEGLYNITNLQPGLYDLTVSGAGFGEKRVPVRVSVGTATTVDVELAVTTGGESIDVVAGSEGVQVNTENQTLQTVITEQQIRELPTITRNPYALVQLAGTAVDIDPEAQDPNTTASDRGAGFNLNGQRSASTNVLLDGADNNSTYDADISNDVPLDSVQEFSVLTNNFSAEFGRASGGIVNAVTKSGTNEFHGTVYEFNRISALATESANLKGQFVPTKKGVFTRNQFGYSVGGPVIRDKVFFFQSTEWLRIRSTDTRIAIVPTPEFIGASAANTQEFFSNYQLVAPITGAIITRGDVVPDFVDDPNDPDDQPTPAQLLPRSFPLFGQVFYQIPIDAGGGLPRNEYQLVGRGDWNINDRMTLYGRYALQSQDYPAGSFSDSPYQGFNTGLTTFDNNFLVSLTRVWNDRFISQTKFAFSRVNGEQPLGEQPVGPTLYLKQNSKSTILGNDVALPGYLPYSPGAAIPAGGPANHFQFYQDQTWTLGNHSVRFGGSFIRIHDDHFFGAFQNAVEELGGSVVQGIDNFLLGEVLRFRVAIDPRGAFPGDTVNFPVTEPLFLRNNRYNEGALYVNDTWKIHPRLTLNLGLRWDYFGVQHNKDPELDSNFYYGPGATKQEQVANGRVLLAEESPVGGLWAQDWNNFGPRVGVAWDIFGDGKTSLRGGYGISYERNFGNVTFNVIQNPPNYAVLDLFSTVPITSSNFGPATGSEGSFTLPRSSLRHVDENIRTAYAHFWSAALEREIFDDYVVSAEYSASKGVDLYSLEDPNGPLSAIHYGFPFDPATNPNAYLNPQYASINTRGNNGFSRYDALTLSVQSRYIQPLGLQFLAKYTWAHAIDNLSSTFSDGSNLFNLGILDPYNPEIDKGDADYDIRHRFIASGIWQIPYARGAEGWRRHLLDGWELTWIFNARTGAPFSIYDCTNAGFRCNRLLQAGPIDTDGQSDAVPLATQGNTFVYIDLTDQLSQAGTYADPLTGLADYGPWPSNMTARNAFRRPGYWNLDGGIYKNVSLTENVTLQLRGEFYNVFNHPNLFLDESSVDISASPLVTAYKEGRRQVQLAAKLIF